MSYKLKVFPPSKFKAGEIALVSHSYWGDHLVRIRQVVDISGYRASHFYALDNLTGGQQI